MKSTMKSAFAFIAVAMMIMVAVVPMVSVFTESSDAASTTAIEVDPEITGEARVVIDVSVYNDSTNSADSGNNIMVTYTAGNGAYSLAFPYEGSTTQVKIAEEKISNVKLTFVDVFGVAVPGYGTVSMGDLVAGNYTAKIVNGLDSSAFTLYFKDGKVPLYGIFSDLSGATISGKYDVYTSATATKAYSEDNAIDADGTTTVYYPIGLAASDIRVKITSLEIKGIENTKAVTVKDELKELDKVTAEEYFVAIDVDSAIDGYTDFEITALTATTGSDYKAVAFKWISKKIVAITGVCAAVTTTTNPTDIVNDKTDDDASKNVKLSIKAADGTSVSNGAVKIEISNSGLYYYMRYVPAEADKAFYGTVEMGDCVEAGKLTVKFSDGASTPKLTSKTIDVDARGYFFTFAPAKSTSITEMSFKSVSSVTIAVDGTFPMEFASANTLNLKDTDFAVVSGELKVGETSLVAGLKAFDVSGADTFGYLITGEDGKFEFMATRGATINFSFNDGVKYEGDISTYVDGVKSAGLKITMSTSTITLDVTDALGEDITDAVVGLYDWKLDLITGEVKLGDKIADFTYSSTNKTYEATFGAGLDPSYYYVNIEKTGYTFEDKEFVDGGVYMADEAAYTVNLYQKDGILPAGTDFTVNTATAYKNSLGSIVYYNVKSVSVANGKFIADASLVGYTKSDITSTPVEVLVLKTGTGLTGIFDAYYVLDADAEGKIAITASVDSFTGKLVKNDGVTPVAGIQVFMKNANDVVIAAATYTQNDGSFTLYSDSKIVDGCKLTFDDISKLGYTFEKSYDVFTDGVKNTTFEVASSTFKVTFVDADGAKIALTTATIGEIDGTVLGNVATFVADWDGTKELAISNVTDRTFAKYTPTAAELAAGAFTVKSNQSTYTFSVVDANGKAIDNTDNVLSGNLYAYNGDIPVKGDALTIAADGTFKLVLPLVADDGKAVTYGYKVTSANGYAFADVAKITEAINVVKSTSALKTVVLQDAAGEDLATTGGKVGVFADGVSTGAAKAFTEGTFSFVATAGIAYTYSFTEVTTYTFDDEIADVDGVVKAKEETITGTVTDASGKATTFGTTGGVTAKVDVYDADGEKIIIDGVPLTSGVKTFTFVAEKSEVAYYIATIATTATAPVNIYTFEKSTVADIKANETKLLITLTTVNGVSKDIGAVDVTYTAGTEVNMPLVDTKYIIVDTTKVSEYSMTVGGNTYTSKTGAFVDYVADYSGSVGVPNVTGSVSYVIYKGSDVTGRGTGTVNAGKYELNDVDTSLGDKIVVTYVNSGKTYSAVLNTAAKTTELVEVVPLDTSLIVLSGETDKITCKGVSADGKYVYLLAEKSYTKQVMGSTSTGSDGHDLAEKFKFDGWYVNGEKVSSEISYTADNTEGNIVAAYYVSDGYYETNKPVDKAENNSSVMIIGIAAVIIALIAVVYAVIQKKQ